METITLEKKLKKLLLLYRVSSKCTLLGIKRIHELRTKTREILSCINKTDKSYEKFKNIIKLTNDIRDIDVFQSEFLVKLPKQYKNHINIDSILSLLNQQRESDLKKLQLYLVSFNLTDKISFKKNVDLEYKELNFIQVTPSMSQKKLHKYRIYIKKQLYAYKLFQANEKSKIKTLTKIKNYLGNINDNLNAYKIIKNFYPSLEEELGDYINKENEKYFQKILQLDTIL